MNIGRNGMKDDEIVALLHRLSRPTFFTLDAGFYTRGLCHEEYSLVYLDVEDDRVAEYVRRLLRHRALDAKAKRLGRVIRASPSGLSFWQVRQRQEQYLTWE